MPPENGSWQTMEPHVSKTSCTTGAQLLAVGSADAASVSPAASRLAASVGSPAALGSWAASSPHAALAAHASSRAQQSLLAELEVLLEALKGEELAPRARSEL